MKLYYAYVVKDMIQYFEEELSKRDVNIIHRGVMINTDGTVLCRYILKANEGIIDPKFEIQSNKSLA